MWERRTTAAPVLYSLSQSVAPRSQHPASFWTSMSLPTAKLQSYCSSWLCLPCPAVLGKLFFFFILRCWKLNPREVKAESWGILRFQSRRVNNKDSQSFFFFPPSLFWGHKNYLQIQHKLNEQVEEQTGKQNTLKIKMFPFWHFLSGIGWLCVLRLSFTP